MKINVCVGSACHLKGSYEVIHTLQALIEANKLEDKVDLYAGFCLGHCTNGVSVQLNENEIVSVSPETVMDFFNSKVLPNL